MGERFAHPAHLYVSGEETETRLDILVLAFPPSYTLFCSFEMASRSLGYSNLLCSQGWP